jgi:hypothetical protein
VYSSFGLLRTGLRPSIGRGDGANICFQGNAK